MDNEIIVLKIKFLCKSNGITQKKLLEDLKINCNYIQDIKNGTKPTVEKIKQIAEYFNVSIDYLIGRTDNPEINK